MSPDIAKAHHAEIEEKAFVLYVERIVEFTKKRGPTGLVSEHELKRKWNKLLDECFMDAEAFVRYREWHARERGWTKE